MWVGVIFGHCAVIKFICSAERSPTYEGEVQYRQSLRSYEWVSLDSVSGIWTLCATESCSVLSALFHQT